jgi:hypothetical protein
MTISSCCAMTDVSRFAKKPQNAKMEVVGDEINY